LQAEISRRCAGKDCQREATITLKLRYLNLHGNFCEICASSLLRDGLAVSEVPPVQPGEEAN